MNAPLSQQLIQAEFVPGFFPSLPAAVYHATEAMSASGAKKMLRSPAHYKLLRDQPSEPTEAMEFGTVVHCGVLEPGELNARVVVIPGEAPKKPSTAQIRAKKPSPETLEAIDWWARFNELAFGKLVMAADDYARAVRCIDAVLAHPAARTLLQGAQVEGSLFWYDGRYGCACKARFDARNYGGLVDLKTCQDASPEAFGRQAASLLYHAQAAHYLSGAEHVLHATPEFFTWIAVESEPPHGVAVYQIDGAAVLAGQHLMNIALERYARALKTGRFDGYSSTIERLRLPKWATTFTDFN